MTKDLTTGSEGRVLLRFALPVIGGNLFQLFYTLADTVIVGRTIGADALAAVGATSSIVYLILCFIQGLTSGFGIRLGQLFGAKNETGMRRSVAASTLLSILFTVLLTAVSCALAHPILSLLNTPEDIYDMAFSYLFVIFLGTGATVFYNLISNLLRALGDSRTPLIFLIFSALLNIVLDVVFIVPLHMGVAGAAWATVLSQLLSAVLCTIFALKRFPVLHVGRDAWKGAPSLMGDHLKIGFPMGFQMSVMCIGQLAMQAAVNEIGTAAIAGYTAATKVDQLSVLVDNAFGVAISNFVAQNFGAGLYPRIRKGVNACLIQLEVCNLAMGALLLACQRFVVPLFVDHPTAEIMGYAQSYLTVVIPFYLLLGLLMVYRTSLQSIGVGWAPFAACIIELIMRILCAMGLSRRFGYPGICFATPLAWIGAVALLIPVYFIVMHRRCPKTAR